MSNKDFFENFSTENTPKSTVTKKQQEDNEFVDFIKDSSSYLFKQARDVLRPGAPVAVNIFSKLQNTDDERVRRINELTNNKYDSGGYRVEIPAITSTKKALSEGSFDPIFDELKTDFKDSSPSTGMSSAAFNVNPLKGVKKVVDFFSPEVVKQTGLSEYIDDSTGLQLTLGFADKPEEYKRALETYLTKKPVVNEDGETEFVNRRFEIIEDKERKFFQPKYYISVEKNDGTFTNYSNPMQGAYDFMSRAAGQLGFDVAIGTADISTAVAAANAVSRGSGFFLKRVPIIGQTMAGLLGAATFMYTAYGNGVTAERLREDYLKQHLGLTDGEAKTFEDFIEDAISIQSRGLIGEEYESTAAERLSGYFTAGFGSFGRVLDKIAQAGGSLQEVGASQVLKDAGPMYEKELKSLDLPKEKFGEGYARGNFDIEIYPQVLEAIKALEKTRAVKGRFNFGVDIGDMALHQYMPSPILNRLAGFSSQLNTIIPSKIRINAQKLTEYFKTYADREVFRGGGTAKYEDFRKPFDEITEYFESLGLDGKKDIDLIAKRIGAADEMFFLLRAMDAKMQYNEVFRVIGNANYDLSDLDSYIAKNLLGDVIPKTEPVKTTGKAVKRTDVEPETASINLRDLGQEKYLTKIANQILNLGSVTKGKRTLTQPQIRKAIKEYQEANLYIPKDEKTGNPIDLNMVDTPAELLHLYAISLGKIAHKRYYPSADGRSGNKDLYEATMALRKKVLDTMANPMERKGNELAGVTKIGPAEKTKINELITDANEFYNETFEMQGQSMEGLTFQKELKIALKNGKGGPLVDRFLTTPIRGEGILPLGNIKGQMAYMKGETPIATGMSRLQLYGPDAIDRLRQKLKKFKIKDDMFDPVTGNLSDVYKDIQDEFIAGLYARLAKQTGSKLSVKKDDYSVSELLKGLDDVDKEMLGLTKDLENYFLQTSEDLAFLFDAKVMERVNRLTPDSPLNTVIKDAFEQGDLEYNLKTLLADKKFTDHTGSAITTKSSNPFVQATRSDSMRKAIFEYLFAPAENKGYGVFKVADKNTPLADANVELLDVGRLMQFMNQIEQSPTAKTILTDVDMEVLEIVKQIGMAQKTAATDAGTALAGAQIIGELFTIDGKKLIGGLARLGAQKRIAEALTNPTVVKFMMGMASQKKQPTYLERVLFGKGAIADILTNLARDYTRGETEEERLEKENEREKYIYDDAPGFSNLNQQTDKLFANAAP